MDSAQHYLEMHVLLMLKSVDRFSGFGGNRISSSHQMVLLLGLVRLFRLSLLVEFLRETESDQLQEQEYRYYC